MRTKEVIARVKKFRDYFDFDLANTSNLVTKGDCKEALECHKQWLEDAVGDACNQIDDFIHELGIEYEDL